MSGMQHVKRAERDANAFAFGFELFDVVEDQLCCIQVGLAST